MRKKDLDKRTNFRNDNKKSLIKFLEAGQGPGQPGHNPSSYVPYLLAAAVWVNRG